MILLTGASGFIGKHLLGGLIAEYGQDGVLALTSEPVEGCPYLLHQGYRFDKDIFVRSGYAGIHTIVHAGAAIPANAAQSNLWRRFNDNILNTDILLKAELPHLKKVIYLSTLDVYGKSEVISESSPVGPASLYGYSKLYCEQMIKAFAAEANVVGQILRVGHVYGPGEEKVQKIIPATIRKLLAGQQPEIWGEGKERRSFIYIKDIVKAVLQALRLEKSIGTVNLVGGQPVAVRDLVDKLIKIGGSPVEPRYIPTDQVPRDLVFDNSKMKESLLDRETPLDKGLQEEFDHMKKLIL